MIVRELFVELGLDLDEGTFAKGEKALAAIRTGALGVVSAFVSVGAALVSAAGFTARTADHVDELSQSLGVSADELQRIGYAAGFSSLSIEQVGQSMKFLAKHGVKDIQGELLKLADQFSRMPNGGEKTRLALEKLGKSGTDLIPMLNEGRAKLEELFAEAPVLDAETIRAGVELSDSITRIQGALKKLVFAVGAPLLKPLGEVADRLVRWFRANEKLIKGRVVEFVEGFKTAVEGLGSVLSRLWFILDNTVQLLGGWEGVLASATAGLLAFGIAVNAPLAGLAAFLLILDDVFGYFEGKDSVTGDLIGAWKKFIAEMFSAPSWQDSEFVTFLKWVAEKIEWIEKKAKSIGGYFASDIPKVQIPFVNDAPTDTNPNNKNALGYFMHLAGIERQAPTTFAPAPTGAVNKTNNVEINVNGAGDPKAVAQKVREEVSYLFEGADEVYS